MVTLSPEDPERLDGDKDGNRQITDSDGSDDGQDGRMQAAQAARPAAGRPDATANEIAEPAASALAPVAATLGDVERGDLADRPNLPESLFGALFVAAVEGP